MSALFKSAPMNLGEHAKALSREKNFQETYADLIAEWNDRLLKSGMPVDEVLCDHEQSNHVSRDFTPEAEQFYINCRRFYWVENFHGLTVDEITARRIWNLYCDGLTYREIEKEINIPRMNAFRIVHELLSRMRQAITDGLLAPTPDSNEERMRWNRFRESCAEAKVRTHLLKRLLAFYNDSVLASIDEDLACTELPYSNELDDTIAQFEASKRQQQQKRA